MTCHSSRSLNGRSRSSMLTAEIIIPTIRANPDLLAGCVEGTFETTGQMPVVVEGGTFAENCNLGADGTDADVVVFLNDDTIPLIGWLEPLIEAFDDPTVGIAGSKLVYPDGSLQHAGVGFRHVGGLLEAFNITDVDPPSRYVEAVTGACLAIRSDLFADLDGFDAGFVNGYEDVDLCLRAREGGWHCWYARESVVVHLESRSGPARWTHVRENVMRLQEKHT